jgi:ethanolamine utilization protein EutA
MAAGRKAQTKILEQLWTREGETLPSALQTGEDEQVVFSFSGGVADCIEKELDWLSFGDIGPILGRAIKESRLCRGEYRLGDETIRATVIGAGCHSAQLSGSTVFHRNVKFPLKNRPVVCLSAREQALPGAELSALIARRLAAQDTEAVLSLPGLISPGYGQVKALAGAILRGVGEQPVMVAVEADMAKALGQAMALQLPLERGCLCIDSVQLTEGSYLDVGAPVGPAMPVLVKTLVIGR